ncbi:hypothetical protein CHS0354_028499 [Potamilus streckersoni]|uniref:Uncharacterized protein n=1 Tax=Potamilus streckersoni TaxID=2493646 RepID=A0AAE0SE72_9BIVA|nr:hypothetical protein CHS0354_028499 [Potamilus streckersoni]
MEPGANIEKQLGTTLDELAFGHTTVDQMSRISVKYINGMWFTSASRHLWVFKNFELLSGCTYIPVIQTTFIDSRKFTTYNGGASVIVRRNPEGKWYNRLLANPTKYHNFLHGLLSDTYNKASSASKANNVFVFQPTSVCRCYEQRDAFRTAQMNTERVERLVSNTPRGNREFPNQTVETSSIEKKNSYAYISTRRL